MKHYIFLFIRRSDCIVTAQTVKNQKHVSLDSPSTN